MSERHLNRLQKLREKIDYTDVLILKLLAKRMELVERVGKYKRKNRMDVLQQDRWEQVLSSKVEKGEKLGLSEEYIKEVWNVFHKYSIKLQETNKNNEETKS